VVFSELQFFEPFTNPQISISELKAFFDKHHLNALNSTLLARYLIEDRTSPEIIYDDSAKAANSAVIDGLKLILGSYKIFDKGDAAETDYGIGER
jgi:hypothetical protein